MMINEIENILARDHIKGIIETYIHTHMDNCRYLLVFAIRDDGQVIHCNGGNATNLELKGLSAGIPDLIDTIIEKRNNDTTATG